MEKTCLLCGAVFQTSDKRVKYCSKKCGAIARHNAFTEYKICVTCGSEFPAKVEHQKYCSALCSSRARTDYYASRYKNRRAIDCGCAYNVEVECFEHNCGNCGWNPEVAKARLDKYMGGSNG
jgi:hypothetical protein